MGWLGGLWGLLPDKCLMRDQSWDELVAWLQDSTCSIHILRLFSAIEDAICDSIMEMRG